MILYVIVFDFIIYHLWYYIFIRLRIKAIEGGDAQTVIDKLMEESEKDPDFYYRVKLNEQGQLIALFWSDSMMREDYKIYRDFVIFDTTYRTNRYNLICGSIMGIINHWKIVMFGCAFIADEKVESFEWVLGQFKKVMNNKSPMSIFTDQDFAMSKAIEKVNNIWFHLVIYNTIFDNIIH